MWFLLGNFLLAYLLAGSLTHVRLRTSEWHAMRHAFLQMLTFNVPGGKLNRGMAVLDVLKAIKGTEVELAQRVMHYQPSVLIYFPG